MVLFDPTCGSSAPFWFTRGGERHPRVGPGAPQCGQFPLDTGRWLAQGRRQKRVAGPFSTAKGADLKMSGPGPHPRPALGPLGVVSFSPTRADGRPWNEGENESQGHSRQPRVRTLKCPVRVRTPVRAWVLSGWSVFPQPWPMADPGTRAKTSRRAIQASPGCGP